jgi:serine/threonine protein kinase
MHMYIHLYKTMKTPPNLSSPCATFLSRCMMINPQDRATAGELLVDPSLLLGCSVKNDSIVDEAVGRSRSSSV